MAEMLRYNAGKLRLSLLPTSFIRALSHNLRGALIEETVRVLEFGAGKYSPNNWRASGSWIKVFDSALRHAFAFACGEEYDQESGLHHLGHLGCNLAFLLEFEEQKSGVDDRYKVATNFNKIENLTATSFTETVLVALLAVLDGMPVKTAVTVLDIYMDGITQPRLKATIVTDEISEETVRDLFGNPPEPATPAGVEIPVVEGVTHLDGYPIDQSSPPLWLHGQGR